MSKAKTVKKVLTIIGNVLLYCFIAVALFAVIVSISAKKDPDGTATVFGYQMRVVQSESMEKCDQTDVSKYKIKDIPLRSVGFVETVPEKESDAVVWYGKLKKGDVLTIKYRYVREQLTITHRIVNDPVYNEATGGYIIKLEGDNKYADSDVLEQEIDTSRIGDVNYFHEVVGKVEKVSYPIGLLLYALTQPVGLICIVILPCLIIIVFEVIKIVRVFGREKKEKDQVEKEKQQSEIEELRRQLELLKNGGAPAPPETPPSAENSDNSGEATTETTENP
jgi:hypothetical protein